MNGNTQKLIWGIMGVLLVISGALYLASQDATNSRLDRIEARQVRMDERMQDIQAKFFELIRDR